MFGKMTKSGWRFSAEEKVQAWEHLVSSRATVTARHENRNKLERLAEVTAQIAELTAERDTLITECESVIVECGKRFGTDGNKWVAFIQRLGKAFPFVLTVIESHQRADFSGWCKANGITSEKVIADGFATQVQRSVKIVPAGKTHIDTLTREHCLEMAEGNK